ncbi:MAG: ATP-grasp domain-containing protein [Clostridium sp.]
MEKKRILMLGANYYQTNAIITAKELGYYVITCDYLPNNPGHKYSDEYYNISTTDKEAVLNLAKKLNIDGIMSYASDVSASTVAYVAEKLNLPSNPLNSIEILTNKGKFRKFLIDNGFNAPKSKVFKENEFDLAKKYIYENSLPIMIKPVDSSGSKGITKLINYKDFKEAFEFALEFSNSKTIVIEDFIEREGNMLEMEGFIVNGEIKFYCAMDQHCDPSCTLFSPIGSSIPTSQSEELQLAAKNTAQKVFDLLKMKFGSFNFEYVVDKNKNIYIMEIGPRNGGNFIPDVINYAKGINLAEYVIKSAVGEDCSSIANCKTRKCVSYYLIHSLKNGRLKEIKINKVIQSKILNKYIYVNSGDYVQKFKDGRMGLGVIILEFENFEEKQKLMSNMNDYVEVIVNEE